MRQPPLPQWWPQKWLYRPDEVAELLGLSARTIWRRMESGEFGDLHREGDGVRITYSGLVGYLEERRIDPLQQKLCHCLPGPATRKKQSR